MSSCSCSVLLCNATVFDFFVIVQRLSLKEFSSVEYLSNRLKEFRQVDDTVRMTVVVFVCFSYWPVCFAICEILSEHVCLSVCLNFLLSVSSYSV